MKNLSAQWYQYNLSHSSLLCEWICLQSQGVISVSIVYLPYEMARIWAREEKSGHTITEPLFFLLTFCLSRFLSFLFLSLWQNQCIFLAVGFQKSIIIPLTPISEKNLMSPFFKTSSWAETVDFITQYAVYVFEKMVWKFNCFDKINVFDIT